MSKLGMSNVVRATAKTTQNRKEISNSHDTDYIRHSLKKDELDWRWIAKCFAEEGAKASSFSRMLRKQMMLSADFMFQ